MTARNVIIQGVSLILAVLAWSGCSQNGGDTAAAGGDLNWVTDYDKALAEAKASGKPVMIDFFATWCGPCKMLDKHTYTDAKVVEQSRSLVAVRIDVDQNQKLAQKYRVESIPTIVFLNSQGKEVRREVGFIAAPKMLEQMRRLHSAAL